MFVDIIECGLFKMTVDLMKIQILNCMLFFSFSVIFSRFREQLIIM